MRFSRIAVAVLLVAVSLSASFAAGRGESATPIPVRIELGHIANDLQQLRALDLDLDGVFDGWVRAWVVPRELVKLETMGFQVTILENRAPIEAGLAKLNPALGTGGAARGRVASQYHTYDTLTVDLAQIAADHPDIVRVISIGQSVQGRELWAVKITKNPDLDEIEPEVAYISSMHGDEVVGKEMCFNFIDYLTDGYGVDPRVTALIDTTEIWIMPSMNPDGTELGQRYNANGYDLNRNFPDQFVDPFNTPNGRQLETQLVMAWVETRSFVLSANMHGGALLVNYPFDNNPQAVVKFSPAPQPDHDVFESISSTYADNNLPMSQVNNGSVVNGITNGAAWYVIDGGMQDWEYVWYGDMEVTIELSFDTWPPGSELPQFWTDNQESMMAYLERVHAGVRGVVTDSGSGQPLAATMLVDSNPFPVYADPDNGDYYRILLPGTYTVTVEAPGYFPQTVPSVVVTAGPPTVVDVQLDPRPVDLHPEGGRVEDAGNGYLDPGETSDLAVTLRNDGGPATAIAGTLISTGWYGEVVRAQATYPDLDGGERGESDVPHHAVTLSAIAPPGHKVGFAVQWNSAEASDLSEPFFLDAGAPLIDVTPTADPPQAIQDMLSTHSEVQVTEDKSISEVLISVDITHTYIGDLEIVLTSPAATQVTLHYRTGGSAHNIVGTYGLDLTAAESLGQLVGESSAGTWALDVYDAAGGDVGTLNSWSVQIHGYPAETSTPELRFRELSHDAGAVTLEWWPYPGLTSYKIYRSTDASSSTAFVDATTQDPDDTDTSFVDPDVDALVFYLVTGIGPNGEGP